MSCSEIEPRDASSRIAEYRIIDVREPQEFRGPLGRIKGAELIPLGTIDARADALAGSRPALMVCRSGNRSMIACDLLQQHGITDACNLAGGMIAWNRAALPIERDEIGSLEALLKSTAAWLAQVTGRPIDEAMKDIDRYLLEAGASRSALSKDATGHALERMASSLEAGGAPSDLDLALAAFRSDLAAL